MILIKGQKKIVIEIKTSATPKLTRGFWNAMDDLKPDEAYVIAPVRQPFSFKNNVWAYSLEDFLKRAMYK